MRRSPLMCSTAPPPLTTPTPDPTFTPSSLPCTLYRARRVHGRRTRLLDVLLVSRMTARQQSSSSSSKARRHWSWLEGGGGGGAKVTADLRNQRCWEATLLTAATIQIYSPSFFFLLFLSSGPHPPQPFPASTPPHPPNSR